MFHDRTRPSLAASWERHRPVARNPERLSRRAEPSSPPVGEPYRPEAALSCQEGRSSPLHPERNRTKRTIPRRGSAAE
jgi:hypothetical protein